MPTLFESQRQGTKIDGGKKKVWPGKKKMGPLTSFAMQPDGVRFETQEEEEKVILFLRQHIIVNVPWVIITIVLLVAPTVLFPLLLGNIQLPVAIPPGFIVIGTLFWYLATIGFAFANFLRWFFNIYIVTDQRIVDIDFYYLLFKRFSQAELHKVQDISFSMGGILATLFNYGNILVETAGEIPNIEFGSVPQPEKTVETIRSLTEKKSNNL